MNEALQSQLEAMGYESREHYILQMSENYDLDPEGVVDIAELLGDEELFDGFLSCLSDLSAALDFRA